MMDRDVHGKRPVVVRALLSSNNTHTFDLEPIEARGYFKSARREG